jgi:hypothetical protein
MNTRATAGLGAGVLLLAGLLAGCSGDDDDGGGSGEGGGDGFAEQSYAEIKQAALDAMGQLEALHVKADIEAGEETSSIDLSMSSDGSCAGTISFGAASAEVLRTPDGAWYKPNADLLAASYPDNTEDVIAFVGDAWVVDSDNRVTGNNCDLKSFVDQLSDDEEETDTGVGEVEDLDGEDVVPLTYTNAAGDGTAYVRVDGDHYLAKIETTGSQNGVATFSGYDEEVVTEAPGKSEVVDLADFKG